MKTYGFKISFMDMTNEWNYVTATHIRDIKAYMVANLAPEDMPLIVAPSAWSYDQGDSWLSGVNTTAKKAAIDIAGCHNTDKTGTAQEFADKVGVIWPGQGKEVWSTELHGWKGDTLAEEIPTSSFMFDCVRAGFSGINGWLAIGTTAQGHCYILNDGSTVERNVKYCIFRKLSTTSNYGHALDVNLPTELTSTMALIRGNLMTVWVLNNNASPAPIRIAPTGRTFSEANVKRTRWHDTLTLEGVTDQIPATANTSVWSSIAGDSLYCFEILLNPIGPQFTKLEAEASNASSGVTLETTTDTGGGQNVGNISRNDWLRFDNLAPGSGSVMRFRIARPSGRPEGRIEVRLDSTTGEVIGSVAMPTTSGWQNFETIEASLAPVTGSRSIYLVFTENGSSTNNSMTNLNWISLIVPPTPATFVSNPASTTSTQATLNWTSVSGATSYQISRSTTPGGPYTLVSTSTGTSFTDTGLITGTSYYYVIKTLFAAASLESANSPERRITASAPITAANYKISSVTRQTIGATDNLVITIPQTGLGQFYQVQASDTLTSNSWINEGSVIMGTGGQLQFTLPISPPATKRFYKVQVWRE